MRNEKVERVLLYIVSLTISVVFYFFLPSWGRENIRSAEEVAAAPRVTVTVNRTWTEPSGKYTTWWMSFEENVASTRTVKITKDEWDALSLGSKLTIAVLPDGTPHTLDMGADPRVEVAFLAIGIAIWAGATFYVIRTSWKWLRPQPAK